MKDMVEVTGQHREARNAGLRVFTDANGAFHATTTADPETPVSGPLPDKAAVTRFARGYIPGPAREPAPRAAGRVVTEEDS